MNRTNLRRMLAAVMTETLPGAGDWRWVDSDVPEHRQEFTRPDGTFVMAPGCTREIVLLDERRGHVVLNCLVPIDDPECVHCLPTPAEMALIEAAPDLLEVAGWVIDRASCFSEVQVRRAKLAVAKARRLLTSPAARD